MIELQYKIQFFSPWHCSSGMGGGKDADYCPIKDVENFPFIPGKTIKGLFRTAADLLQDQDFVEKVFGSPSVKDGEDTREGTALWSNVELPKDIRDSILTENLTEKLYTTRYLVKIDEFGQSDDKSLRRGEYVIPLTLEGKISNLTEEEAEKLRECMGAIKHIGLQRSRGFGKCTISPAGKQELAAPEFKMAKREKEYHFQCTFLSPIVLNTTGATKGALGDTLEYVPGANFLGIAAREYDSFGEEAFAVFHSGKVRFGNAYPLINGELALPCPASWYIAKGKSLEESKILWDPAKRKELQAKLQPKQVRNGYFIPGTAPKMFPAANIFKTFSLKSAYDSEKRKAKESCMYGYTALNAGSSWAFTVTIDPSISDEAAEKIVKSLLGKKSIGRSRSSQYGSIEISLLKESPLKGIRESKKEKHYFYACSQLAFMDANGEPTLLPDLKELGFAADAEFDMEETQIRYHQYSPWNGKRKTRDGERLVILPGSVLVVRSSAAPDLSKLEDGVGLYLAEGFGKLLYNPQFLFCDNLEKLKMNEEKKNRSVCGDPLLASLRKMYKEDKEIQSLYDLVAQFIAENERKFKKVKASQWGAIRAIANGCESYNGMMETFFARNEEKEEITYIDQIKNNRKSHLNDPGFLYHGVAAKRQWQNGLPELFKDAIEEVKQKKGEEFAVSFVILLSSEMAKLAGK